MKKLYSLSVSFSDFLCTNTQVLEIKFLILLFLLSFLSEGNVSAQWSATNLSGNINTIFANGTDLLAGTNGGDGSVITHNDGLNWGAANTGMDQYPDVRAFAANPTYIYAGTTGGVYRSLNNGTYNWTKVLNNASCFSLLINSFGIYAGTMGGGVYFSTDNGTSWTQVNNGISMLYVYALAYNGTYLFAGTYHNGSTPGAGVFRSSDNGQTWTQVINGLTNTTIMSLAVKGSILFAGTDGGGIFRTTDNGNNWTNVAGGVAHTLKVVCGTNLYAGFLSGGGISRSTDNGNTWTAYSTGLPNTGGYTVMSIDASSTKLFAGTLGGGVAKADKNCTTQSAACILWNLTSSQAVTSTSGNISGQSEIISVGSSAPLMQVYGYNNGQELWVGNTGWVPFPTNSPAEDPLRYLEFNAMPTTGNNFTVNNISFNYGDAPLNIDFNILSFLAYYSTDGWSTRTLLNSSALIYKNTAMNTFTVSGLSVPVANGQTFSLRIYPYPILHGIAMTPTFAIHNNVSICGTTEPAKTGSICGQKFNDLNGNGVKDSGESALANWVISIKIQNAAGWVIIKDTTDVNGNYCFNNLQAGTYTVSEINQSGWVQTYPANPGTHTVILTPGQNITGIDFGNKLSSCVKAWTPLTTGTNGEVWALAVIGTDLYVGGNFTTAGGNTANHIAKWNGSAWSPLVSANTSVNGINGIVTALTVIGTDLYAGGWFTTAGGVPALNVAKWDGSNWTALGSGISAAGAINALVAMGNNIYATSYILDPALGGQGNIIAKWDGSNWSQFTSMDDYVSTFLVDGTNLYAGGQFTMIGNVTANHIAKWNGSNWSAFGVGTDFYIGGTGLEMMAGKLYVGGRFLNAGGSTANFIASWNGSAWSSFGSGSNIGMNNSVEGLKTMGSDLYASGSFTTAQGISANSIAKWDGTLWSPLGTGMNDGVWRLAVVGSDLYAGGIFTTAGGVSANYIARYSCTGPNTLNEPQQNQKYDLIQNQPNPFSSTTLIKYYVPETGLVKLSVYDIFGKETNVLVSEVKESGYYERTFDAKNLTSGIYFYTISTNGLTQSKKMIVIR